ncbi:hypothetical protein BL07084 [Bacillus licheniformis DSM 13 = ATCC 14580]|uniref:Uncharacterized protein n=1 Tax=Bacillus licheniformis (strain ATCC 14580 / DSM 13 / JCM 2505 / CCUG 7422 / NBRC 12200 / NCIMB 9375 / NCTC 10341 / NRRL NRS-1264 / Gibson 46) TaxID=279010 RepID=A4VF76_BACLD|nr:hypothetical protein BL07084 [Bacillus licheniformis DSM 13 = ATCC 14580]
MDRQNKAGFSLPKNATGIPFHPLSNGCMPSIILKRTERATTCRLFSCWKAYLIRIA